MWVTKTMALQAPTVVCHDVSALIAFLHYLDILMEPLPIFWEICVKAGTHETIFWPMRHYEANRNYISGRDIVADSGNRTLLSRSVYEESVPLCSY